MLETGEKKELEINFKPQPKLFYFHDAEKDDRFSPCSSNGRFRSFTVPSDLCREEKRLIGTNLSSLDELANEFVIQQTFDNSGLFLNFEKKVDLYKYGITPASEQHIYVNIELNSQENKSAQKFTGLCDLSKDSLSNLELPSNVKVNKENITRWLNEYGITTRLRSFSTNNFRTSEFNDRSKIECLKISNKNCLHSIIQTSPIFKKRSRDKLFTKLMHSKINKVVKITVPKLPDVTFKENEKAPFVNRNNKPYLVKKFIPEVIKEEEMSEEGVKDKVNRII